MQSFAKNLTIFGMHRRAVRLHLSRRILFRPINDGNIHKTQWNRRLAVLRRMFLFYSGEHPD
jgi:hypothetical protein